ncbi:MAG: hypothetical protein LBL32_02735 [Holosporales bacterium]|jgi:chromosome segregation ATPase|nr:hypothetical protein [Holosporales bacterium]
MKKVCLITLLLTIPGNAMQGSNQQSQSPLTPPNTPNPLTSRPLSSLGLSGNTSPIMPQSQASIVAQYHALQEENAALLLELNSTKTSTREHAEAMTTAFQDRIAKLNASIRESEQQKNHVEIELNITTFRVQQLENQVKELEEGHSKLIALQKKKQEADCEIARLTATAKSYQKKASEANAFCAELDRCRLENAKLKRTITDLQNQLDSERAEHALFITQLKAAPVTK